MFSSMAMVFDGNNKHPSLWGYKGAMRFGNPKVAMGQNPGNLVNIPF